jgi:hypothetical protein
MSCEGSHEQEDPFRVVLHALHPLHVRTTDLVDISSQNPKHAVGRLIQKARPATDGNAVRETSDVETGVRSSHGLPRQDRLERGVA